MIPSIHEENDAWAMDEFKKAKQLKRKQRNPSTCSNCPDCGTRYKSVAHSNEHQTVCPVYKRKLNNA
jgi:hypothetical protein